ADAAAARSATLPTPFVGRQREFELLLRCWREAVEHERQVVFISGEPGIGKTRLTWELVRRAEHEGGRTVVGRCDPDRLIPYQPFVEALGGLQAVCPPDELARHLRGVPAAELARLVPTLPQELPGA